MRAGSTAAAWTSLAKAAAQSESVKIQEYLVHSAPAPQPGHAACAQELCTVLLPTGGVTAAQPFSRQHLKA